MENYQLIKAQPDCEIVTERILNAPVEKVFKAWSDPVSLAKWWGPKGFTNTIHLFDFREGGKWELTMHGPDKGNYENESVFFKIEPPVFIAWQRISQPVFQVQVSFKPLDSDKTHLVFRMVFENKKLCDTIRKFAPAANEENFDKLEAELASMI